MASPSGLVFLLQDDYGRRCCGVADVVAVSGVVVTALVIVVVVAVGELLMGPLLQLTLQLSLL